MIQESWFPISLNRSWKFNKEMMIIYLKWSKELYFSKFIIMLFTIDSMKLGNSSLFLKLRKSLTQEKTKFCVAEQ